MAINIKVLGFEFRPMSDADYQGFAGANEGCYIYEHENDNTVLIWDPSTKELSEIRSDDMGNDLGEFVWKSTQYSG